MASASSVTSYLERSISEDGMSENSEFGRGISSGGSGLYGGFRRYDKDQYDKDQPARQVLVESN
jgi:hypothetical protein